MSWQPPATWRRPSSAASPTTTGVLDQVLLLEELFVIELNNPGIGPETREKWAAVVATGPDDNLRANVCAAYCDW